MLMGDKYRHARQKGLKIFEKKEIEKAKSELEKERRLFWNEKAEQLSTHSETANQDKCTLIGIIDVAWTLRKTTLLEEEERKTALDEHELFSMKDCTTSTSLHGRAKGKQKASTIPKNVERMVTIHDNFIQTDKEMAIMKEQLTRANEIDKKEIKEQLSKLKLKLDSSYTKLKQAQDALSKALKQKRDLLNIRLTK